MDPNTAAYQTFIPPAKKLFALPESGEALLTDRMLAGALGISKSSLWSWVKTDPAFPQPVRRGERFTRFKLSDARAYIAGLDAGSPKVMPLARQGGHQ